MNSLKHENIIMTKAVGKGLYDKEDGSKPQEVLFIVMELAPEGELFDIVANTGKFSEPVARYFFL